MHIFKTMIVLQIIHTCTTIGLNITVNVHRFFLLHVYIESYWMTGCGKTVGINNTE